MHLSIVGLFLSAFMLSAADSSKLSSLELRIYHVAEGKVDAQVERFEKVADKMFRKYNLAPLGYWLTTNEAKEVKFVYILGTTSREENKANFKSLVADQEFKDFYKASAEKHGTVTKKVESIFLKPFEGSPTPTFSSKDVTELRLYTVEPDKMDALVESHKKNRVPLFKKHGVREPKFWTSEDQAKWPNLFVLMLSYPNEAAAKSSTAAYQKDPAWVDADKEWNKNGPLTSKVESHLLYPVNLKTQ